MLRTRPLDGDTLFQVNCEIGEGAAEPAGVRHCATFGKSFMEAIHLVRNQFGAEHVAGVSIVEVYTRERDKDGTIHDTYFFPTRRRETIPAPELNHEFAQPRAADG